MSPRAAIALADLRRQSRVPYGGALLVQLERDGTWLRVFARDVSEGGFGFVSTTPMTCGDVLSVWPIDAAEPLAATVRHVSCDVGCFEVGVEFDEPLPYALMHVLTG